MPGSVAIETARFRLRNLKPSDASETLARLGAGPAVMHPLNNPARDMSLDYLARYASSFDGKNRHLIGVFEKATGAHIGFFMVEIDSVHRLATFNVVIGDKDWWGKRVVNESRAALLDYFFERRSIEKACGSPLSRNFPAVLITRSKAGATRARCAGTECPRSMDRGLININLDYCVKSGACFERRRIMTDLFQRGNSWRTPSRLKSMSCRITRALVISSAGTVWFT